MILDGHIHISGYEVKKAELINSMKKAGVDGGILLSNTPGSFSFDEKKYTFEERLNNLFSWADIGACLYPFFWIDPVEEDAVGQVEFAVKRGVAGFKVICNRFFPGDSRAMKVFKIIAGNKKPILFHSGILWDGTDSSKYNRPAEFEALLDINGLKFALAHISWPWCDENIAVYGKFLNAYNKRPDLSVEMFIDITPGTPPIYRREVMTKLFGSGYDVENNIIFGTDCSTDNYSYKWAGEWIERDNDIYDKLGIGDEIKKKIYSENLKRFIGMNTEVESKKYPKTAE